MAKPVSYDSDTAVEPSCTGFVQYSVVSTENVLVATGSCIFSAIFAGIILACLLQNTLLKTNGRLHGAIIIVTAFACAIAAIGAVLLITGGPQGVPC